MAGRARPTRAGALRLDPARVLGLATRLGGTTSHTAIIARQLGLPCVVAVGGLADVPEGATVLLDGEQGTVTVDPDPEDGAARVVGRDVDHGLPARLRQGHRDQSVVWTENRPGVGQAHPGRQLDRDAL